MNPLTGIFSYVQNSRFLVAKTENYLNAALVTPELCIKI